MIQLDVAKAGAQLFNLSSLFNVRVHDGFTPVKVQWVNSTDGNKPLDVKSMKAFLKGRIGQGTIKDDHVELEPKSDLVSWEDDGSGSQPNGITLIKLPPQVFTRDGVFYGYIGLMDTNGTVITSINIWFNVDQNIMTAGANVPYYLDEIQAALSAIQRSNDTLQRAKQEIDNQISLSKAAFEPEGFENETALKAKYPAGASGLMVTVDTGHKWLWIKGTWKDCGQFQNAALPDTFKTDFNNFRNSVIVAMYQYQLNMSKQLDDFKQQTGETVQSRSGAFRLKGIDLLDQNGNQILDQIGRKIQVEQLLPITDYYGDQAGLPADSSIVGQTFLSNINRYGTMVIYLDNLDLPNLKKEDGKLKNIPFHIANPKGDLPENGVLDAIKVQGASSAFFDKKNYTINFKERHTVNGWARNKKFVLKGDWNDFSHLRNVGSAKLWANMRKTAISASDVLMINDNDALLDNDNNNIVGEADAQLGIGQGYGAIDGFPCFLVINNTYWGLYNFTIPKDGIMARMSGHGKEAIVSASDWAPETLFKAPIAIKDDGTPDYKGFEVEYVANEDDQNWIGTSLNTLINAVDADYDTDQAWIDEVSKYLDFNSAIDHFILTVLTDDQDGTSKNYLLQTWDGKKWYFASYDMDSTFGQHVADGRKLEAPNRSGHINFDNYNNKLMWLIAKRCKQQLYDRYRQLRSGVLSEISVNQTLENYAMQIPKDAYEYESKRWPSTPGTSVKTLYQLENWYQLSSNLIDKKVEELSGQQN